MLAEALRENDASGITRRRKRAYRSGKAALEKAKKFAPMQPEVFRLMGTLNWLTGKQKKALSWWDKSIRTGKRSGARPDTARTYREVGRRLSEGSSRFRELAGIPAEEYLEKARTLFKELE